MSDFISFVKDNPIVGGALVLVVLLIILLIFLIVKLVNAGKKEEKILSNQSGAFPYRQPQVPVNHMPNNPQGNFQQNFAPVNNPGNFNANNNQYNINPVQNIHNPQGNFNRPLSPNEPGNGIQQNGFNQYGSIDGSNKIEQAPYKFSSPNLNADVKPEPIQQVSQPGETQVLFTEMQSNMYETELLTNEMKIPLAKLEYEQDGQIKEYAMLSPSITIGRDPGNCDFVISFDTHIGRKHAVLEKRGNSFYIVDLNSRNGTFINGVKLTSEAEIFDGDKIRLAATEFNFIIY